MLTIFFQAEESSPDGGQRRHSNRPHKLPARFADDSPPHPVIKDPLGDDDDEDSEDEDDQPLSSRRQTINNSKTKKTKTKFFFYFK